MMSFEEICVKFVGMDTYAGIFFLLGDICWELGGRKAVVLAQFNQS